MKAGKEEKWNKNKKFKGNKKVLKGAFISVNTYENILNQQSNFTYQKIRKMN